MIRDSEPELEAFQKPGAESIFKSPEPEGFQKPGAVLKGAGSATLVVIIVTGIFIFVALFSCLTYSAILQANPS